MTTYYDHSNSYEGSYAHMFDEQLAAKRKLKKQNEQLQQRVIALETACQTVMGWIDTTIGECPLDIPEAAYMSNTLRDALYGDAAAGEFVTITTSPAVVKALIDALVTIDKAAPKDMPNMSHYALPAGGIGGDWRAYHHDCAKYQLAQRARQALAFVQLASEEPEAEEDTRKLPVQTVIMEEGNTHPTVITEHPGGGFSIHHNKGMLFDKFAQIAAEVEAEDSNALTPMQQAERQLASETPDQTQAHVDAILAKPEELITDDERRYLGVTIGWDYDNQRSADDIDESVETVAPAIDDSATWHIPPVTVPAETETVPPLSEFRRIPAERIQEGDLIIRRSQVWRVKRRSGSTTSVRIHFDVFPVDGGRPERDVYFPRQWLFAYKGAQ